MTTEHKHTPGPWRVERVQCGKGYQRGVDSIEVHGQGYVARVGPLGADDLDIAAANAALIARAPELLAENERLRARVEQAERWHNEAAEQCAKLETVVAEQLQVNNGIAFKHGTALAQNAELLSALRVIADRPGNADTRERARAAIEKAGVR